LDACDPSAVDSRTTFGHDELNQLTSISGTTSASDVYNGDGLRVSKTVGATTTGTPGSASQTAAPASTQLMQLVNDKFARHDPAPYFPTHIGVTVVDHTAFAPTSLEPSGEDLQLARTACQSVAVCVFINTNNALGLNEVLNR